MKLRRILFGGACLLLAQCASAWQIEPIVTATDEALIRRLSILERIPLLIGKYADRMIGDPLHEAIILRAEGCQLDNPSKCFKERKSYARGLEPIFAGVQWNDNPPFHLDRKGFRYKSGKMAASRCLGDTIRLPRLPECWLAAMNDAEDVATEYLIGPEYPILYRSHYGDLQFLHGMATNTDKGADTQRKMMIWAEFAYKVARGDIATTTSVDKVPVDGFPQLIGIRERTVESLFTLGDPAFRTSPMINWFALGTLLHMIQDTFSEAHAERGEEGGMCREEGAQALRQPGLIKRFHSYDRQDADKHKTADSRDAFHRHDTMIGTNAIDATRNVLALHRQRAEWPVVRDYLSCVFRLAEGADALPPDAGTGFEKDSH